MTAVLSYDRARVVRSSWLEEGGRRLDCNPYMSGALEARDALNGLDVPKQALKSLTTGHRGGIYNGPIFRRNYVDSSRYGVPFMSSGTMLLADLSSLPLLRKKDAVSARLNYLQLVPGATLISCSGTIGRMAYVRPDMADMWSSQDVLKVVPNREMIPPGYLHAFLSSKFGVPLVVSGTYGAIIQHIEPEHIAKLPVPRFGESFEAKVHDLVDSAGSLLASYQTSLDRATRMLFDWANVPNPTGAEWGKDKSDLGFHVASSAAEPLRAWNHSLRVQRLKGAIQDGDFSLLADLVDQDWLRWRLMFKRIDASPEFGIELLTQRPLFQLFPEGRWINRRLLLDHSKKYVVPDRTILVAKQGTLGEDELFCRSEFITGERPLARAYSDHCMRLVVRPGAIEAGYLFAFLRSDAGFRILRSLAEGSKQQDLHWRTVPTLPVPRLSPPKESEIAELVYGAYAARNRAVDQMMDAVGLVERRISGDA